MCQFDKLHRDTLFSVFVTEFPSMLTDTQLKQNLSDLCGFKASPVYRVSSRTAEHTVKLSLKIKIKINTTKKMLV